MWMQLLGYDFTLNTKVITVKYDVATWYGYLSLCAPSHDSLM
jgi:hypothetical protein